MGMYLNLSLIVVSFALIIVIVLQSRGGLGGLTGSDYSGSGFHVRRGIERLLFNVTIALSVIFFILAVLNVLLAG